MGLRMDNLTPERRSWNMSRIRSKGTMPEILVRSILHRLGFRFRLHRKDLPGSPDIVLPKHKTVLLVHGCFWHHHEGCKDGSIPKTNTVFWLEKIRKNIARDRRVISSLKLAGWRVMTIWECETRNVEALTARLNQVLHSPYLVELP